MDFSSLLIWVVFFAIAFYLYKRIRRRKKKIIRAENYQNDLDITNSGKVDYNLYRNFLLKNIFLNPIYFFLLLFFIIYMSTLDYTNLSNLNPREFLPIFLIVVLVLYVIFTFIQIKKIYKNSKILNALVKFRITNSGIQSTGETIDAMQKWEHFIDFKETNDFYIFYSSPSTATFIQKNWLEAQQRSEFDKFLNSTVN